MRNTWELDRSVGDGDIVFSTASLRHVLVNGHRTNVVTGRAIPERKPVFSPPDEPPLPTVAEVDELLDESAEVRAYAKQLGKQIVDDLAELNIVIPDDASTIFENEPVTI